MPRCFNIHLRHVTAVTAGFDTHTGLGAGWNLQNGSRIGIVTHTHRTKSCVIVDIAVQQIVSLTGDRILMTGNGTAGSAETSVNPDSCLLDAIVLGSNVAGNGISTACNTAIRQITVTNGNIACDIFNITGMSGIDVPFTLIKMMAVLPLESS